MITKTRISIDNLNREIAERKKAEERLHKTEEKYRTQFEGTLDAIFVADAETGIITDCNPAATRLVGRGKSELIGQHQRILHPPETIEGEFSNTFKQHLGEKHGETLEAQVITKTGKIKDVAINASPLEIGGKKMLQGIFRDITENKKAERDLRETQNYLENLINYANAPIIVWTPDLKITKFNHAFEHLTGRSTEEVLGKELSILFPEENCEQVLLEIKRTLSGNNWESVEIPILNKDGSIRVALWNSANIYAENGTTLTATIAQGMDITERKRVEEALRESEQRLTIVLNSILTGVVIVDAETHEIVDANPLAIELIGLPKEKIIGKVCNKFICPAEKGKCPISDLGQTVDQSERLLIRGDGKEISILKTVTPAFWQGRSYFVESFVDITIRKKAERDLRETQNYLENLINYANAPIIVWTPDLKITKFNHAFEHLTGRSTEEVLGKELSILFPEENCEQVLLEIKRTLSGNNWESVEIPILNKDGSIRVALWNSANIYAENGTTLTATIAQGMDITERKRVEKTLRESEERYKSLFKANIDGILIADPTTKKFRYANPAICRMLGYSEEELTQMGVADIHPKESLEQVIAEFEALASGSKITAKDLLCVRKDGQVISVSINAGKVMIDQTKYLLAIFRDVTERKQAEQQLRRAEENYRTQFEGTLDAIFVADAETGIIVDCNPAATRLVGREKSELIGQHQRILHPPESIEGKFSKTFKEHLKEKQGQVLETQIITKTGEIRDVTINASPLEIGGKKVLQGIFRDVTENKKAEQHQAQLLEQLEKINQELKDFAYIVSHDLKAPLRGIKTLTEWITTDYADKLDENGKEQMNLLERRVDRMNNLIDGVLQYSRVGRVKEDMVQINLNELIPEVIDSLAPPENISITIENELPAIKFEWTRIMQVFQNLLSNAVKYMDKPQGQIKIGCIEENGFWKFSVADNGPGIEEKYFGKIFQLFQTLAPRDESESTGVGLTVVKKIIEMYKGSVWVESEVGNGSTFFFTLPKALRVTNNEKQLLTSSSSC